MGAGGGGVLSSVTTFNGSEDRSELILSSVIIFSVFKQLKDFNKID